MWLIQEGVFQHIDLELDITLLEKYSQLSRSIFSWNSMEISYFISRRLNQQAKQDDPNTHISVKSIRAKEVDVTPKSFFIYWFSGKVSTHISS